MLFIKSTARTVSPGVFGVDIAAKPPGKTFSIFIAVDAENPPQVFLDAIEGLGFTRAQSSPYMHGDGIKVLDIHYEKHGTDLFKGWTEAERQTNLQAVETVLASFDIIVTPRVMSLAEAFK